ncbi:MFS transporter [Vagococcus silagei]|uniref:MFS transporter n=1 Tax=Vagococcus silagei TaxID=2508885 RepID=A0A4S3B0N8_9ENTE|nr:MFS transporter [Vagococcus silagei]THB60332.1 MFS transporter [Vagococcus silagei]
MENTIQTKHTTFIYATLQFIYWAMNCSIYSFAGMLFIYAVKNQGKPISNGTLSFGIMLSLANLISAFLQPYISEAIIKKYHYSLTKIIIILNTLTSLSLLILPFILNSGAFLLFGFGISLVLILTMQPFINALGFDFINHNIPINFGVSRGAGSIGFALSSFVVGLILSRYSPKYLPLIVLCLSLLLFVPVLLLKSSSHHQESSQDVEKTKMTLLFSKYPFLLELLIGFSSLFIFHTFVTSLLGHLLTGRGGTSANLGIALMIAGFCELPAMFFFSSLIKIKDSKYWVNFSAIFFFIRSIALFLAFTPSLMISTQFLQSTSFALFIPASAYLFNQYLDPSDNTLGQSLITATMTIGGVLGNLIGSFFLRTFISPTPLLIFGIIVTGFGFISIHCGLKKMTATP